MSRHDTTIGDICMVSALLATASLVCLKWSGLLAWSWWAVLSPIWGTIALYFVTGLLVIYWTQRGDTT